jgi:hypothetical protein
MRPVRCRWRGRGCSWWPSGFYHENSGGRSPNIEETRHFLPSRCSPAGLLANSVIKMQKGANERAICTLPLPGKPTLSRRLSESGTGSDKSLSISTTWTTTHSAGASRISSSPTTDREIEAVNTMAMRLSKAMAAEPRSSATSSPHLVAAMPSSKAMTPIARYVTR